MTEANETLQAEVERLRAENQRLRDEVERLRAELHRTGRYLREPPPRASDSADEAEVGWAYQRGDLDDDLGDD
jgi:predicted RNase H-like nuclease (RuvC/YqgF family)